MSPEEVQCWQCGKWEGRDEVVRRSVSHGFTISRENLCRSCARWHVTQQVALLFILSAAVIAWLIWV